MNVGCSGAETMNVVDTVHVGICLGRQCMWAAVGAERVNVDRDSVCGQRCVPETMHVGSSVGRDSTCRQ